MPTASVVNFLKNPFLFFLVLPWTLVIILLTQFRNRLYDLGILKSYQSRFRILSIGNLTMGGTGKSPVVAAITEEFLKKQMKVAVVLRSYRASAKVPILVKVDSEVSLVGDEALQLKSLFPELVVVSGPNKTASVQFIENSLDMEFDWIIIDDGLQHRRLKKDHQVLLFDAMSELSEYRWPPFGRLRDNFEEVFNVQTIFFTNCQANETDSQKWLSSFFKVRASNVKFYPWQGEVVLPKKPQLNAGLISGIAKPEHFFKMMSSFLPQLKTEGHLVFSDHYSYSDQDLAMIQDWMKAQNISEIFCTEKDFVKIQKTVLMNLPIYPVKYSLKPSSEIKEFYEIFV